MQSVRCIIRRQAICTSAQTLSSSTVSSTLVRCIHTTSPLRQHAEEEKPEKLSTAEKLRRRIWGTNAPPGAANPYEGKSQLEQEELVEAEEERLAAPDQELYIPDTDARNMIKVGSRGNFMQREWDALHPVKIYTTRRRCTLPTEIERLTRRAVFEGFAKYFISEEPNTGVVSKDFLTSINSLGGNILFEMAEEQTGEYQFYYSSEQVMREIGEGKHDKKTSQAIAKSWKDLPLTDHAIKFAVMKRLRELTGIIIPDPVISVLLSVGDILAYILQPQPAKDFSKESLATKLTHQDSPIQLDLSEVKNVTIHQHRVRPSDRERAIGRTESIALIEAGKLRQPGDSKKGMFLKRRRLLGLGVHSIETLPEHQRSWSDWQKMMARDAAIANGESLPEDVEEVEDGQIIR